MLEHRLRCGGSSDSDGQDQGFAGLVTSQHAGPHHSTAPMQQGERCPCAVAVSHTIAPVSFLPIKRMRGRQREDLSCLASTPMMITSPYTQLHPCGNPELHLNSSRHPPLCPQPSSPTPTGAHRCSAAQLLSRLRQAPRHLRAASQAHRITAPKGPPMDRCLPPNARAIHAFTAGFTRHRSTARAGLAPFCCATTRHTCTGPPRPTDPSDPESRRRHGPGP